MTDNIKLWCAILDIELESASDESAIQKAFKKRSVKGEYRHRDKGGSDTKFLALQEARAGLLELIQQQGQEQPRRQQPGHGGRYGHQPERRQQQQQQQRRTNGFGFQRREHPARTAHRERQEQDRREQQEQQQRNGPTSDNTARAGPNFRNSSNNDPFRRQQDAGAAEQVRQKDEEILRLQAEIRKANRHAEEKRRTEAELRDQLASTKKERDAAKQEKKDVQQHFQQEVAAAQQHLKRDFDDQKKKAAFWALKFIMCCIGTALWLGWWNGTTFTQSVTTMVCFVAVSLFMLFLFEKVTAGLFEMAEGRTTDI